MYQHNFLQEKLIIYLFCSLKWFKFEQKSINNYKPQKAQKISFIHYCSFVFP
jgi:hypothetical protein